MGVVNLWPWEVSREVSKDFSGLFFGFEENPGSCSGMEKGTQIQRDFRDSFGVGSAGSGGGGAHGSGICSLGIFPAHLDRCGSKSCPIQGPEWENASGIALWESSHSLRIESTGKSPSNPKGIPGSYWLPGKVHQEFSPSRDQL